MKNLYASLLSCLTSRSFAWLSIEIDTPRSNKAIDIRLYRCDGFFHAFSRMWFRKLFRSELVKIQTTSPDNVSALPQFNTIKNSLYRTRNEKYPPLPKSIDDVKLEVIDNSSPRYLCFGTTDALKLLCDPEHIFMDGTFKSCPSPFAQ
ncbi:unnamed protein product, partial [Didymodactylos carnosus]